jgi:hypothetical protein
MTHVIHITERDGTDHDVERTPGQMAMLYSPYELGLLAIGKPVRRDDGTEHLDLEQHAQRLANERPPRRDWLSALPGGVVVGVFLLAITGWMQ